MIALSRSIGDYINKGFGLLNSADILARKGLYNEAERRLNTAYHQFILLDEKRMIHATEQTFAFLFKNKNEHDKARYYYKKATEGLVGMNVINQLPELFYEYGDLEDRCGDVENANRIFEKGLEYAEQMKDLTWMDRLRKRLDGRGK